MSDRVRLGLVGAGVAAQAIHLPVIHRQSDLFEVTAVCDPSPRARAAVADRCGIGASGRHDRFEELLDGGNVDAVLVLTSGSHGRICAQAAAVGLPVFCEKPLAYTLAEADALTAIPSRLAVGYMKLYDSAFQRALDALDGAQPFRSVEVTVLHPSARAQLRHLELVPSDEVPTDTRVALEAETEQLLELALGSVSPMIRHLYAWRLLGSIVHDLALVRVLAGDPVRCLHAEAWPVDDPDSLTIDCLLPDDVHLSIHWHYLAAYPMYTEEVRVHHGSGSVQVVFPSPYLSAAPTIVQVVDEVGARARTRRFESSGSSFETELLAFHDLVTAGTPTAAGVAEGRADIVTCQRIIRRFAEIRSLPVGGEAASA
jgi:predicted dehydrogenase